MGEQKINDQCRQFANSNMRCWMVEKRLGVAVHVSITGPSILTNALELMMMTLIIKPRKPDCSLLCEQSMPLCAKRLVADPLKEKCPSLTQIPFERSFARLVCCVISSSSRIHRGIITSPLTPALMVLCQGHFC